MRPAQILALEVLRESMVGHADNQLEVGKLGGLVGAAALVQRTASAAVQRGWGGREEGVPAGVLALPADGGGEARHVLATVFAMMDVKAHRGVGGAPRQMVRGPACMRWQDGH